MTWQTDTIGELSCVGVRIGPIAVYRMHNQRLQPPEAE
jgi:hypothetical protein